MKEHPDWTPSQLGLPPLSRVRLDELLQELLDRVADVMASRERLRRLLDAVVGVGADLDLRSTLERIVVAACQLTNAGYGALGVLGEDDHLTEFITHGIDPRRHEQIGALPTGHGVLGLLIADPRPVRVPDITAHPRSVGFPPHHPPMRSFLGVPVRIRQKAFGNLYLADKRGAAEFTDDDEEITVALAAAAGTAIENARLYEVAQRRHRWMTATAQILTGLSADATREQALSLVARQARECAAAALVVVLLHDEAAGTLSVEALDAAEPVDGLPGAVVPVAGSALERLLNGHEHVAVEHVGKAASWPVALPALRAIAAPLTETKGVLLVGYRGRVNSADELPMLAAFAAQAGLALQQAVAREDRQQLMVLADRERIARDLHDLVIQRLFATGLQLQTTSSMSPKPDVAARINAAVDELDKTIRDIRGAIFELRSPAGESLRGQIRTVVLAARESLGFAPDLTTEGPIDSATPDAMHADVLAVIREALSNVARHAGADRVGVTVRVAPGIITIVVSDNGSGGAAERGGLSNLRERARRRGGSFTIESAAWGTALSWTVPVSGA